MSHAHCGACRAKDGGRQWRESLANAFELPPDAPDFTCPHGRPWGYIPPSKGVGDTIAKITSAVGIKPCGGCKKRRAKLNEMFPYKDK